MRRWARGMTQCFRRPALIAVAWVLLFASGVPAAYAQQTFDTAEAAVRMLIDASKANDEKALVDLFGAKHRSLIGAQDKEADRRDRDLFSQAAAEHLVLRAESDDTIVVVVGFEAWPFPIPLVRRDGRWQFDAAAGREELLNRRIGRNELLAIRVLHAYVAAQHQYALKARDGTKVRAFARKVVSSPGKRDGLYWPADPDEGEEISPFGPLIRDPGKGSAKKPYNGYYFKILTSQGASAPGGAYSYVINGRMVAGFAMVAAPARYGETGIKSFIVNHYDEVYERDLGPDTQRIFREMTRYAPTSRWTPAK
jgi:hypothetical protein